LLGCSASLSIFVIFFDFFSFRVEAGILFTIIYISIFLFSFSFSFGIFPVSPSPRLLIEDLVPFFLFGLGFCGCFGDVLFMLAFMAMALMRIFFLSFSKWNLEGGEFVLDGVFSR